MHYSEPKSIFSKRNVVVIFVGAAVSLILAIVLINNTANEKPVTKTSEIKNVNVGTIKGENVSASKDTLQTRTQLVFESKEIKPNIKGANAAVLKWGQAGDDEGSKVELRINNSGTWSRWSPASEADDRKDNTPVPHSALIVGTDIEKIQYRFILSGQQNENSLSPKIDLTSSSIEMIDSTKGPSPTKPKTGLSAMFDSLGFGDKASARMDGPHIYSRAEWGSPEPDSSPRWDPEYQPLYRVIVHHTVTTNGADPSASIRAIWQYHANTLGWGDIGYNYLVDAAGNIFQGRYFDPNVVASIKKDVVGGHAYGNNQGTSGIAALGDFTSDRPSDAMIDGIANIAAFKAANYSFNPSGIGPAGPNLIGHRDVYNTGCPGEQLYARLQEIRNVADLYYYPRAALNRYDLTNQGQGYDGNFATSTSMMAGETRQTYFDLRNEGDSNWGNYGSNPTILATDAPRDRASVFATPTGWRSSNRAATFNNKVVTDGNGTKQLVATDTILPGETARFQFLMTAPEAGGTYLERFQLVVEGQEWFSRNLLLSTNITVTPRIYSWRPTAQHIFTDDQQTTSGRTTDLSPGQRVYLVIKAENTGNQTWYSNGANPIKVGTSNGRDRASPVCDSTWLGCNRSAVLQETSVAPGQIGTFGFWIKAPSSPANFRSNEYFSLVAEGKAWINTEPGISWPVSVNSP